MTNYERQMTDPYEGGPKIRPVCLGRKSHRPEGREEEIGNYAKNLFFIAALVYPSSEDNPVYG